MYLKNLTDNEILKVNAIMAGESFIKGLHYFKIIFFYIPNNTVYSIYFQKSILRTWLKLWPKDSSPLAKLFQ